MSRRKQETQNHRGLIEMVVLFNFRTGRVVVMHQYSAQHFNKNCAARRVEVDGENALQLWFCCIVKSGKLGTDGSTQQTFVHFV